MRFALITKTWLDQRRSVLWWILGIGILCTVQLWVYPTIRDSAAALQKFLDLYPDALKKIFRMQDYTSGPGYLSTELFSLMLPLILIAIGCSAGARAGSQEEEDGTADLLLALPISRRAVLANKVGANLVVLCMFGSLIFLLLALGSPIVDLHISSTHLLAGVFNTTLLGVAFTSLTTFAGAATGRKGLALGVGVGSALTFYILFSLAGLVHSFEHLLPVNPFQWTIGHAPLFNGMDWAGSAKLASFSVICLVASMWSFDRRDIRS